MRKRSWLLIAVVVLSRVLAQVPVVPPIPAVRTEKVAMRDGVKLATDLHLPPGNGPWPVLLIRTPYSRVKAAGLGRLGLVGGYAVVIQDVRGRFDSEGDNLPFLFDGWGAQQDGVDTCKWVLAQTWCNGNIGTYGGSALGITQLLTAAAEPPGVKCQWIGVAAADMYSEISHVGGAFTHQLTANWLKGAAFNPKALDLNLDHPNYDEYWAGLNATARVAKVTLPAVLQGGWYDVFQQGTINAFVARQTLGGEGARGRQKLIIGPWTHGGAGAPTGELTYPASARRLPPQAPNEVSWFAYWLKGEHNGAADAPAVCYYTMGAVGEPGAPGNAWHTAAKWPVDSTPTPLYLQPDGTATFAPPPANGVSRKYLYDPTKPVPTLGGCNLYPPAGTTDQRKAESRPDVLVFTTAPLEAPLELTGRLTATLWVASSAQDTDFTAKLTDVYPDGRSMLVDDGILRLRFRNSVEQPEPLVPGQAYEVKVDLWSTSLVFNRGHRLRVAISSSNYPRFDANPNAGPPFARGAAPTPCTNTLFLDAAHPSRLLLPVVK